MSEVETTNAIWRAHEVKLWKCQFLNLGLPIEPILITFLSIKFAFENSK
jgi:hypothetical protein